MQVTAVLGAQAIRFVKVPAVAEEDRVPTYPLLKGLQERYSFLQVPNKVEDFNYTTGVTFLSGLFEKKVIEKFQVYERGVLCDTKTDTDHCERFIDDVLSFGRELGLPFSNADSPDRAYFSSLEVNVDGELGEHIAKLSAASSFMMEKFKAYGLTTKAFPMIGFKLSTDATNESVPIPAEYVFERRSGQPFSKSLYASWGPLRTSDHIEFLQMLEKMMTA